MSNGEESAADGPEEGEGDALDTDTLTTRITAAADAIEAAETEADLDDVAATIEDIAADLEAADLPEPDDDEDDPRDRIEDDLEAVRTQLEDARGPYAEDVVQTVEAAAETVADAELTEAGRTEAAEAIQAFLETVTDTFDASIPVEDADLSALTSALAEATTVVADADLDPDEDADLLDDLLAAAEALAAGLEDAEVWDDLMVHEQLQAQGFYDRLTAENRRDFPPELGVVRVAERERDADRLLLALDAFDSNFMEDNILDALRRLAPPAAVEPMLERAEKRDRPAIRVLGKIGDDRAVETLVEFIADEGNPPLQKDVLRSLGEIGSESATQAVANRLVAEDAGVRSHAARALGRIGDTRAIDPLADVLADDEAGQVRAAAAWALNQIGTERALSAAADYADDRVHGVQAEAEKARDAA